MTGWLSLTRRPSATSRAERSVIPAGGNGTISRIGREGKDCADPAADMRTQQSRLARQQRKLAGSLMRIRFMTMHTLCHMDLCHINGALPAAAGCGARSLDHKLQLPCDRQKRLDRSQVGRSKG